MHGNVYEWCQDFYEKYEIKRSFLIGPKETVIDPIGPSSGGSRVFRGGSWDLRAWYCRSAHRNRCGPRYYRRDYLGFRLVPNC